MTKFRVHLEHDKSVVVEAVYFKVRGSGSLEFFDKDFNILTVFGPYRWVWVEKESEESHWDSEPSEESGEQGDG